MTKYINGGRDRTQSRSQLTPFVVYDVGSFHDCGIIACKGDGDLIVIGQSCRGFYKSDFYGRLFHDTVGSDHADTSGTDSSKSKRPSQRYTKNLVKDNTSMGAGGDFQVSDFIDKCKWFIKYNSSEEYIQYDSYCQNCSLLKKNS